MSQTDRKRNIKIGYLPLAHDSYWNHFPDKKAEALVLARKYGEYLSQFGTVFETGNLIDSPEKSREARIYFQAKDVDVYVLTSVTYSTPDDVMLDLQKFSRPAIVWNTQASSTINRDMNFDKWMYEHGITGVPGLTNLLQRNRIPYFLVSGHYSSSPVRNSFETIFQAVSAANRVWGSKIGVFGHLYPGMIDFGYDPTMMYSKFGAATVPVSDTEVLKFYREISEKDIDALKSDLLSKYSLADEFKDEEFIRSVRIALAMKRIVVEKELDAVSVYCQSIWQNPEIGVVSCIGNSILLENGVFVTCEGDVPTALSGIILSEFTDRSFFTEIWCNDFDSDQFMMGHSGQMNLKLFENNTGCVKLGRHPWWNGCCGYGACLRLKMPAGEVTFMSISPAEDGKWSIIASTAEITDRDPVPLGAPNFFVKLKKPITQFIEEWGNAGAAHHVAMSYGNWINQIKAFARIINVELSLI